MTTGGEGGMITTSDSELWSRMWSFKDHGKSYDAVYNREHPPGFRWLHESFASNWRMMEMQAVIGRIQLQRMPQWQAQRLANCEAIWRTARECPGLRAPEVPAAIEHAGYKCYLFVEPEKLAPGWDRDAVQHAITERGVPCMSGACSEVYREKNFQDANLAPSSPLPIARELGSTSLMLLCHPTLTEAEIAKTCDVLKAVMQEAAAQ